MMKTKIKVLSKFKNLLIKNGKLAFANFLILRILEKIKKKTKKNSIHMSSVALKYVTPGIDTRKYVVAGKLYNLPSPITKRKAVYYSCNWIKTAAIENKEYKNNSLDFKIAEEFLKVLSKKGQSFVFLKQHNKMVSDNRPFLRFIRRKFKPRMSRKLWLKKKRLLWLSRKQKYKKPFSNSYNFSFGLNYTSFRIRPAKKHMKHYRTEVYSRFKAYRYWKISNLKRRILKKSKKLKNVKNKTTNYKNKILSRA